MVYRYHLYTGTVYQYIDLDGFWVLGLFFFLISSPPTDFIVAIHHCLCDQDIDFSILNCNFSYGLEICF